MVEYSKEVLSNGLRVIVHEDKSTPLVAVNLLYNVGSRDEDEDKTGFTHLFEHLMFSGTRNIPDFDDVIQNAGGENNAFTNNDITNFYEILPYQNLESALWLEADRMRRPFFTQKKLDVQKKVVIEEFKETCLNEPYGDMWHHMSDMCYKVHPYRWPTIGKNIQHIENAGLDDVEEFFNRYYRPSNAILVLSGHIGHREGHALAKKWFSDIEAGTAYRNEIRFESQERRSEYKTVLSEVPLPSIVMAFPMAERLHPEYYKADLLSDILGSGRSSRMYKRLVRDEGFCFYTDTFISGTKDPGLLIIESKLSEGAKVSDVRKAIWKELDTLKANTLSERELQKIKNKAESSLVFSETSILNKAMSLAYYEHIDQLDLINTEVDKYMAITAEELRASAEGMFDPDNVKELVYMPKTSV